jgi:hypothetical protein
VRAEAASYQLARRSYLLGIASFVVAGVAAAAAIIAVLVSIWLSQPGPCG